MKVVLQLFICELVDLKYENFPKHGIYYMCNILEP